MLLDWSPVLDRRTASPDESPAPPQDHSRGSIQGSIELERFDVSQLPFGNTPLLFPCRLRRPDH